MLYWQQILDTSFILLLHKGMASVAIDIQTPLTMSCARCSLTVPLYPSTLARPRDISSLQEASKGVWEVTGFSYPDGWDRGLGGSYDKPNYLCPGCVQAVQDFVKEGVK